ncbi:predicted protein, partial [Nematostella vectensis]
IVIATICTVASLLATTGNVLVIAAIFRSVRLKTVSNFFLASLAVADLLVGAVILPVITAKTLMREWLSTYSLVFAIEILALQAKVASTFNLSAVSIDRYIAVTRVFQYEDIMTRKKCFTVIACVWIGSIFIALLRLTVSDPVHIGIVWMVSEFVDFIIPLCIILFCYFHIFAIARRQNRQINAENTSTDRSRQLAKSTKAAFTVGIVIGVFFMLLIASFITVMVQFTSDPCGQVRMYKVWAWVGPIQLLNSACNPLIYSIRSREFRSAFRKLL